MGVYHGLIVTQYGMSDGTCRPKAWNQSRVPLALFPRDLRQSHARMFYLCPAVQGQATPVDVSRSSEEFEQATWR